MNGARLIIAGLSGDSGKTIVSLSLMATLKHRGLTIAPFKKGPDYIDPAWLSIASGNTCRNLDSWMIDRKKVYTSFVNHSEEADISIIEGNRGLFDGQDIEGTHSTADLAKLLQTPLVLVINATKATRTIAAIVKGCMEFDPELNLIGVVLNKVAGLRHQKIITESIKKYCGLPILGVIPKLGKDAEIIPGRHLGLIPPAEYLATNKVEEKLCQIGEDFLDVDKLVEIAGTAPGLDKVEKPQQVLTGKAVRIGYFKDSVFTFYYPENLEALEQQGAKLIPVSSLADSKLPEIDGLFIGGGFPETQAERLIENRSLMESVKAAAENSLPIYAECGGLIYLCKSLKWKDKTYPMAGLFPVELEMHEKPIGHGYAELTIEKDNPYFKTNETIRGHEFHYSGVLLGLEKTETCMKLKKGVGLGGKKDGLVYKNSMACYTHIHADSVPEWAPAFIELARKYTVQRSSRGGGSLSMFRMASMA